MSKEMTLKEKIELFKSLFAGRVDCFNIDETKYDELSDDPKHHVKKQQYMNMDKGNRIPLTDEHIANHINGTYPIALFPKLPDDTIRFACVDFDYPWDFASVAAVRATITHPSGRWGGVPCYLARSSRKGWHLWFFFSDWMNMKLFTSFWSDVIRKTDIYDIVNQEKQDEDGKFHPLPELFPRMTSFGDGANPESFKCGAIKPPMVEPRMKYGFNAFYKEKEANPIVEADQWKVLSEVKTQTPAKVPQGFLSEVAI